MEPAEGAVRRRKVPTRLRGKTAKAVLEWARGELNGVEPDLGSDLVKKIRTGELTEVILRPKRPGFFLADGTFVEAFDYKPSFGDDLDEAEKQWENEEKDNTWADEENRRFNKKTAEGQLRFGQAMWEHGRRIEKYAEENQRSVSRLLHLLERRKGPEGYSRHTHQTCVDFYRWKPDLGQTDPILDWKWERIDAILRFANNDPLRNYLTRLLQNTDLGGLRDDLLARLLGIKAREPDLYLQADDLSALQEIRKAIRAMQEPTSSQIARGLEIIKRISSPSVPSGRESAGPD